MATMPEQYRLVFHAPGADAVLADLIASVSRMAETERAGAYALIARITRMLHTPEAPPRVRGIRATGGRIAHG